LIRAFDSENTEPKPLEANVQKQPEDSHLVTLRPSYKRLFDEVRKEAEGRKWDGDWFVICGTPMWVLDWKIIWCDSVKHRGSTVKFVCHSPEAPDSCPSVSAQMQMNTRHLGVDDGVKYLKDRLNNLNYELADWMRRAQTQAIPFEGRKGHFEFYESFIMQPYVAILFVPRNVVSAQTWPKEAPKGTWCVVGLYLLYAESLEERCGFYLDQPSPMLDVYYNSVLNFFALGEKHHYIAHMKFLPKKSKKTDG
jgi:hypothetical protein